MNPNNIVCRTCLGIIPEGNVAYNIDDKNDLIQYVRNIREMITFCVPEMDVFRSFSPVICESCLGILVSVYNFKIRCLRVENAICSYIKLNNVLKGSCVNLNNVVRQQIVEALKRKRWPLALINEYVNKHLCGVASTPQASSHGRLVRAQNVNAPRLNNSNSRSPITNVFEQPRSASICSESPPAASNHTLPLRGFQINKNLEGSPQTETVKDIPLNNPPMDPLLTSVVPNDIVSDQSQDITLSPTDLKLVFLSALQLTSSPSAGREETVLIKKKVLKRALRSSRKLLGSQNFIPIKPGGSEANQCLSPAENLLNANGKSTSAITKIQERLNVEVDSRSSELRKVRNSVTSNVVNNNASCMGKNDSIILENDTGMVTPKVGDETLIMNLDENADIFVNNEEFGSRIIVNETPSVAKFNERISARLPKVDTEKLKRKLSLEDKIIDEILSKRRKLVVKVNSSLPYLHKELIVKLPRQTFYLCKFCKFVNMHEKRLEEHYMRSHKVCARCSFKCDGDAWMTQHINIDHPFELKEVLKIYSVDKTEFHCHLCRFTGLSEFDLRDHRLRMHIKCNTSGMYKCPLLNCDKESPVANVISEHIETKHDKLKQTRCPLCSYVATSTDSLKRHVQSHSMDKLMCPFCSFGCKTSFSLKKHMKDKHLLTQKEFNWHSIHKKFDRN